MMDLVLEQMQEQPVAALGLDAGISVEAHSGAERLLRQGIADGNEPPIDSRLLALQVRHGGAGHPVGPRLGAEPAALEAIDVEPVDDQDVVERRLEAGKEAGPRRLELLLASGARRPPAGDDWPRHCCRPWRGRFRRWWRTWLSSEPPTALSSTSDYTISTEPTIGATLAKRAGIDALSSEASHETPSDRFFRGCWLACWRRCPAARGSRLVSSGMLQRPGLRAGRQPSCGARMEAIW